MEVGLAVQTALSRLTEDQRETVVLKIYEGFKFEEMAEILGAGVDNQVAPLHRPRPAQGFPVSDSITGCGMSCSSIDIKDYFFGELPAQDRRTLELHLASCPNCQEELDASISRKMPC